MRQFPNKYGSFILMILMLCLVMLPGYGENDMGILPALANRTTLHSGYDPNRLLTEDQISLLLQAGYSMPSGGGQRSLEFFVVTDRTQMAVMRGGNPYSQALETAPCVIVLAADNDKAYYEELLEMDAGLAAGGILVQASELGLTTCVLSIAPQEQRMRSVREALKLPISYTPILMIAVGYPDNDAVTSASVQR